MINIAGRIYIEIKIDGKPLSGANLVGNLLLLEGTPVIAPSLMMMLNDHSGTLTRELCLTDGNEILVTVGKTPNDLKTVSRQYRLFSVTQVTGQSGPQLKVLAMYDAPAWTIESARDSYSGTAAQVIKQIAEKCKLEYDGPEGFNGRTTTDSQVWLTVGKTRGAFVQQGIARYAYMDEHSAMYCALSSMGVVKFRNIMDVIATTPEEVKYVFVHNINEGDADSNRQVYRVNQSKERSDAGLMNSWINYGSTQLTDGPSGVTQSETKVDVKTSAPFLAINDQVAQTVGKSKVTYGPIDCGNVHEKYYRALYQNKRQLALFSERISLLVTDPTEVQLFDPVIYKQADQDPTRPVRNTDIYMVVGKTIAVPGGQHYAERIELVRMSITEKGAAELKSSEPTSARESSIPDTLVDPTATVAANVISRTRGIGAIVGPIENAMRGVREKAANVLNNAKLTLPSLTNISNNIGSFLQYPDTALKNLNSGAASLRQLKDTYDDYKDSLDAAVKAVRQGNITMLAENVNGLARTAAYFRPEGIAENLSAMLGVTQVMQTTAQIYNSVSEELAPMRNALDAAVGMGNKVDSFRSDITGVVDGYQSQIGSIASGFNSLVQNVTGDNPNLQVPNLDLNRYYMEDLVRQSVTSVSTPIDQISNKVPTVESVQRDMVARLRIKDDSRNYTWAPESGYVLPKIPADQLASKVRELTDFIDVADRQATDYSYERSIV